MVANRKECSVLEQNSVIKDLMAEHCIQHEIYSRMCNVCREIGFPQENVYKCVKHVSASINGLNMCLPQQLKRQSMV